MKMKRLGVATLSASDSTSSESVRFLRSEEQIPTVIDPEASQGSPGPGRRLPRQLDHVVLRGLDPARLSSRLVVAETPPGLHPAPPPARVEVHLLQSPARPVLPREIGQLRC